MVWVFKFHAEINAIPVPVSKQWKIKTAPSAAVVALTLNANYRVKFIAWTPKLFITHLQQNWLMKEFGHFSNRTFSSHGSTECLIWETSSIAEHVLV